MYTTVRYYSERLFVVTSAIYLLLIAVLPVDRSAMFRYHMTEGRVRLASLSVVVPYLIIWYIATVGYARLVRYVQKIDGHQDGAALNVLSWGVFLLGIWLPFSAILSTILTAVQIIHPAIAPATVQLNIYVNIVFLFVTFMVILQGSKQMLGIIIDHELALPPAVMVSFLAFSALYTFLVLRDPSRRMPSTHVSVATYYLPDWIIVLTVITPRLITWYVGIRAAYNLHAYHNRVDGRIYRRAMYHLANGLLWVCISIMALRCIQTLTDLLFGYSFAAIIAVIYLLLLFISVGYILIARGAHNLLRIEEA